MRPRREGGVTLGGLSAGHPQLMLDTGAGQRSACAIGKDWAVGASIDSGKPPPELCSGAPPERHGTLLASLAVQKHGGGPIEEDVADA